MIREKEFERVFMATQSINPRTGEPFGPVFEDTSPGDIEKIISEAKIGMSAWSTVSIAKRAQALDSIASALDGNVADLVEIADLETGLGVPRLTGEVGRTTYQIREFAKAIRSGQFVSPEVDLAVDAPLPVGHPELIRAVSPLGIVVVFGANNFPFAFSVLGGDSASALAAGCAVIAKAHPSHPQTSTKVYQLATRALAEQGFPAGIFSLIHGVGAGVAVLESEAVSAGAFTGSRAGGRALFDIAQARETPIPFYGELGSVNPVVVLKSGLTDPKAFASAYLDSLLMGNGQFCTNPSVLFVPAESDVISEIDAQIANRTATPFLSPASKNAHDKNRARLAALLNTDPTIGKCPDDGGIYSSPGVIKTTISKALAEPDVLTTECFGPTGLLISYSSTAELLSMIQHMEGALVGSVFAQANDPSAIDVCKVIAGKVGRVSWNAWPTGVAVSVGQQHGGPYPASTSSIHTSVGLHSITRFLRPVTYQNLPREIADQIIH